ncbi:MAG: hypothetical protein ACON3Z_00510 [Bradymonadia bacterium]
MILQFPTETLEFRAEREEAVAVFRQRCRLPVIRQYGFESQDIGMYTAKCLSCGDITARLHHFTDLDADLDVLGLEAELTSRALDPGFGWVPACCPACGADSPRPVSALFARYFPEVGLDLHIHLVRGGHRITQVDYSVMNLKGESRAIEKPQDCIMFADTFGVPLSIRSLWSYLIAQHMYEPSIALYPVQPGYCLGVRPFAETDSVLAAMAEPFYQWLEKEQASGGADVIAYLRDLDDDNIDVAYGDSYHSWLAGFASDVERAIVDPFIVVDSNAFVSVIDQLAHMYGLSAQRDSGADTLYIRIGTDEISVRLNVGPLLFRTIHEGLTFQAGVKRHFIDEIRAIAASAETLKLVRHALPDYRFEILNGHYLRVTDANGLELTLVDVIRAGTSYDPRDETEFLALCEDLAPGAAPLELTLGRPMAGHLAPVIPRKIA